MLISAGIRHVPEIALLMEAHAHHRDAQIARGLEVVAGQDPQTARIERQRLAEAEPPR